MIVTEINKLPTVTGVYFFYDAKDVLLYIGKSVNIKKRVQQHFSGKDRKSIKIQLFAKRIEYEAMGSELIALLHESDLIKKHQPLYNRSQRRAIYQYGLYQDIQNGYKSLQIEKINPLKEEITSFTNLHQAKHALFEITENYRLCQKINGLYKSATSCFQYQIKECDGACLELESTTSYNQRVDEFLNKITFEKFTRLFEVAGRNEKEKGLVYIENGVYKGFGFCPIKTKPSRFLDYIEMKTDNKDVRRILIRYLINQKE